MSTQTPTPAAEPPKPPNTIKIDGREIPFEPGDTIIKAAHRAGIDIPHYCWHPGLSVAANCRMCLVELPPPKGRPAMRLDVRHSVMPQTDHAHSDHGTSRSSPRLVARDS